MKSILAISLMLLSLMQSAVAQTMKDYFAPKYKHPEVDLSIAKDYTFIVPQQTAYQKGNCLSYKPKSISGDFTLLLEKSTLLEVMQQSDRQAYQNFQDYIKLAKTDNFGCQRLEANAKAEDRDIEKFFQSAINAGKTTILNEHGNIVPNVTVVYVAYYQMGEIFYKIDNSILWVESWYIS